MNTSKILLGFLILLLLASPITAISLLALTKPIPTYVPSAPFTMPLFKLTCDNDPPCNIDPCGTYNTYDECTAAANNCNVKIQCHVNGEYPDGTCETVPCGQQANNWMSPPFTGTTCNAMTISNCQDIADNLHTECNAQTGKCDIVESGGYNGYCGAVTCKENCIQYYYTCNTCGTCSATDDTTATPCTNTFGSQCCSDNGTFITSQSGYCKQPHVSTICYTAGNATVGGICAPPLGGGSTSCPDGGTTYTSISDCVTGHCAACGACVGVGTDYATCLLSGCDVCNEQNGTVTTPCYTLPSDSDASYCAAGNTCACRYGSNNGWKYVENYDKTMSCSNAQCIGCTPIYVGSSNCGSSTNCEYIPKICGGDTCVSDFFSCQYMKVSDLVPQPDDVMVCPTGGKCTIGLPLPNSLPNGADGYDASLYMCDDDLTTPCELASVVWPNGDYKKIINQLSINYTVSRGNCSAAYPCTGGIKPNNNC